MPKAHYNGFKKKKKKTVYHGVGGLVALARQKNDQLNQLQLSKFNDSRKLMVKAGALDDHKQWILAIASGRVDHVASLVQVGLKHRAGIKALVQQYEHAADKLYQPKGYSNEDIMRSIVLLRLGGAHVAEFTHHSLSLPSLTTIWRNMILQTLVVSPSTPTVAEVEANIRSCYSLGPSESSTPDPLPNSESLGVTHQIVMLDELAVEKRIRWDDSQNKFQGTCHEHNHYIPLDFTSEKELDVLCDAIGENKVHYATEVRDQKYFLLIYSNLEIEQATVAVIGVLSSEPREYAVRLVLFSGTCKMETSEQHTRLVKTVLEACNGQSKRNNLMYRTVSIASDGEAKHGDALVILTMTSQLSERSPIYPLLRPLELMNLLVGADDITADKDFKHVIKCQRNIFMRNKGVEIQGFCITPSILRLHLQLNNVSSHRLHSLLNPNDKQDVVLAYSLLKEIWSLPPPPPTSSPSFARARSALNLYGQFAQNLVLPYVCVDLNLDEQLIHLSTAAHLAFHLYRDNSAHMQFMPSQSYVDIVLMTKNIYFCVAKMKADNPMGKFYLILLGTDRLETLFGLIHIAVGTDANMDTLQLRSCASGLTEVAVILAKHPKWDHGMHRLSLPVMSREMGEITSKADHISPKDWRGDIAIMNVNLHTCWLLGRRWAVELILEAEPLLNKPAASEVDGRRVDMLSPFGQLLVNQRDEGQEYNCSDLSNQYPPPDHGHPKPPSTPYMHEGDLKDVIADEMPRNRVSSEVIIQGQKTSKAKALCYQMASQASRSSTDHLKHVQHLPCFDALSTVPSDSDLIGQVIASSDSDLGAASLRIGNPFAVLVRCKGLLVLAVAQVNHLKFASRDDLNELPLHLLVDPTARVDSQILHLHLATLEDDPTQVHDWCWTLQMEASCDDIPGQLVLPINPSVSIQSPGKPTFLFKSTFLVTLSCRLFQQLRPKDRKNLPVIQRSEFFPYCNAGASRVDNIVISS